MTTLVNPQRLLKIWGQSDSENPVVRDNFENLTKTVTKPQKEHDSVTELREIEKTPVKNDTKIDADFDHKTAQNNGEIKCVTELNTELKPSNVK